MIPIDTSWHSTTLESQPITTRDKATVHVQVWLNYHVFEAGVAASHYVGSKYVNAAVHAGVSDIAQQVVRQSLPDYTLDQILDKTFWLKELHETLGRKLDSIGVHCGFIMFKSVILDASTVVSMLKDFAPSILVLNDATIQELGLEKSRQESDDASTKSN